MPETGSDVKLFLPLSIRFYEGIKKDELIETEDFLRVSRTYRGRRCSLPAKFPHTITY
jgi:hypothetical protein